MPKTPTRDKLLLSAYDEIYRHGFQGASIDAILDDCKVTKGSMYHHFKSKKELALAVIDEILAPKMAAMFDAINPEHSLQTNLFQLIDFIGAIPHILDSGCPLNKLINEMSPLDSDFKVHLSLIHHTLHYNLQKVIDQGIAKGDIKKQDSNVLATFIIATVWGNISLGEGVVTPESYQKAMQHLKFYINTL